MKKFKGIKIIRSTFSDHDMIELDISNRKISENFPSICKLTHTLQNHMSNIKYERKIKWYF